ncbi:MAG: OmpA family protein [Saprospiraceae bacterium]|nr:OmpA family protein [Saprospiraceae bacterium]
MDASMKTLFIAFLLPSVLFGQKFQEKPVWQFDLLFDFAKADLKSDYHPRLDSLVVALQDSTFVVYLKAHTDAVGDIKANQLLSEKRAQSVKTYILNKNTPENRIYTEGYGESQPVVENNTDEGRHRNRRVAVSVMRRLALVHGIVTDSASGVPMTQAKVILGSKFIRDTVLTDANGAFSFGVRLNQGAKIKVIPNSLADCKTYDGAIFNPNKWSIEQNVKIKCSTPSVTAKKAPQKVKISGFVTNDSNKVMSNTRLILISDSIRDSVMTDAKGYYYFSGMLYTDVQVSISAAQHLPFYKRIKVDSTEQKQDFQIQTIAVGKKASLQNINFYYGTAEVMTESKSALEELLLFMGSNPRLYVEIRGHITSNSPRLDTGYTIMSDVSYLRARFVYNYLVENGIKAERMTFKGYANSEMIYPYPQNEEEHKANRRVEIKIIREEKE